MFSIIPLTSMPNAKFKVKVPVNSLNLSLQFESSYNEISKYWLLNILDSDGNYLISSLPVIPTGANTTAINILEQYDYLKIGSAYVIPAETVEQEWPDNVTVGVKWYLIWGDNIG